MKVETLDRVQGTPRRRKTDEEMWEAYFFDIPASREPHLPLALPIKRNPAA